MNVFTLTLHKEMGASLKLLVDSISADKQL